jgi:hypothetical protein
MRAYFLILFPAAASAQCVMCARTTAAHNAATTDVLLQGVAILLAGPLLIGGAIAVLAWKKRDRQKSS